MARDAPHDDRTAADAAPGAARAEIGGLPAVAKLPAAAPPQAGGQRKHRLKRSWLLLLVLPAAIFLGYRWFYLAPALPSGIGFGNGRLEADQIDIDSKFAGRIAKLFVDEGDMVAAGQVVAAMDTRDVAASLKKSEALVEQAQRALGEAKANLAQQETQVVFARQELDRTEALVQKGFATVEQRDQRRQQLAAASAAQEAAMQRVQGAEHAVDAATHDVELYRVDILDNTLVAPRQGRIEYRVANVGEVLAAGGKVFTMLDTAYVYMDIYLPTADAGRIRLGSDARIVLDAYPQHVIPAKVVFIASQAQFTPKTVETKDERDKLMFRVRVRIDPERLKGRAEIVRSGLPGVAYVRTDPQAAWPPQLLPSPPP
jgi:HlyD family secretion protein